jgi:hypothetical protein
MTGMIFKLMAYNIKNLKNFLQIMKLNPLLVEANIVYRIGDSTLLFSTLHTIKVEMIQK